MKLANSIPVRILLAILVVLGTVGVPLSQHICAMKGTAELISSCAMHEEQNKSDCCADDDETPAITPRIGQPGLNDTGCCSERDVTMQVKDDYTVPSNVHQMVLTAPDLLAAAPFPSIHPAATGAFSALTPRSDSPPGVDTRLLLSSLLI